MSCNTNDTTKYDTKAITEGMTVTHYSTPYTVHITNQTDAYLFLELTHPEATRLNITLKLSKKRGNIVSTNWGGKTDKYSYGRYHFIRKEVVNA